MSEAGARPGARFPGGADDNSKHKSLMHGAAPTIERCGSFKKDIATIKAFVKAAQDTSQTSSTTVVFPCRSLQ